MERLQLIRNRWLGQQSTCMCHLSHRRAPARGCLVNVPYTRADCCSTRGIFTLLIPHIELMRLFLRGKGPDAVLWDAGSASIASGVGTREQLNFAPLCFAP